MWCPYRDSNSEIHGPKPCACAKFRHMDILVPVKRFEPFACRLKACCSTKWAIPAQLVSSPGFEPRKSCFWSKHVCHSIKRTNGAANRIWTGTEFLPKDFKSFVSANFTIAAYGGEGRIRTHETLLSNGFQDRLLKPLGHFTIKAFLIRKAFLLFWYAESDICGGQFRLLKAELRYCQSTLGPWGEQMDSNH